MATQAPIHSGYFTSVDYNEEIHVYLKCMCPEQELRHVDKAKFILKRADGYILDSLTSQPPTQRQTFTKREPGRYRLEVELHSYEGSVSRISDLEIDTTRYTHGSWLCRAFQEHLKERLSVSKAPAPRASQNLKGFRRLPPNGKDYDLQVMFQDGGNETVKNRPPLTLEGFPQITFEPVWVATRWSHTGRAANLNRFCNLYRVKTQKQDSRQKLELAKRLEQLDIVKYVAFDLPVYPLQKALETAKVAPSLEQTPDLTVHQGYLDDNLGMNARNAWKQDANGEQASVRFLDFGVFEDHEDLKGYIDVVTNAGYAKNHGSASAGCIAAGNNGKGVTGVAWGARLYMYDNTSWQRILADYCPGDIIAFNIQGSGGLPYAPAVHDKRYWDAVRALVDAGAIVLFAAGNGGLDLATHSDFNNYGDSGGIMVGSCNHNDGKRHSTSNYNLHATLNSWGDNVATTGTLRQNGDGADLWDGGTPETRYMYFGGTSSATPLTAAALAVVQGYAIRRYNLCLDTAHMHALVTEAGYKEVQVQQIGARPNIKATLDLLDQIIGGRRA